MRLHQLAEPSALEVAISSAGLIALLTSIAACSGESGSSVASGSASSNGGSNGRATTSPATQGGATTFGGSGGSVVSPSGGVRNTGGGTASSGGAAQTGGIGASGGIASNSGGASSTGGSTDNTSSTGGTQQVGGTSSTGGVRQTGGSSTTGGSALTSGGSINSGGAATGGKAASGASSTGGSVAVVCAASSACVDFSSAQQEIDGFGASSAWHGVLNTAELDAAFKNDTTSQLGLSILRVDIDPKGQSAWSSQKTNATNAKARGAKYVLATPWSPPASMKTNGSTVGGELKTTSYSDYAAYLKSYYQYMGNVDVISVQNEPNITVSYDSCTWNATQLFNFTKNNAQDIGAPYMMPETYNYDTSYSDSTLNDTVAASHVSHIGLHLYGSTMKTYTVAVQKQKKIWMTEKYYDPDDIGAMMSMAKEIMDCMNNQMNAYVWWYLRMPKCNLITSSGSILNKGYIMGQFSKYIRPGSFRASGNYQPQANVNVQAFSGAKNVIVALNRNTVAKMQTFTITSGTFANVHRYTTSSNKKLTDDGAVVVANGSFTVSLDAQSVTTFVAGD